MPPLSMTGELTEEELKFLPGKILLDEEGSWIVFEDEVHSHDLRVHGNDSWEEAVENHDATNYVFPHPDRDPESFLLVFLAPEEDLGTPPDNYP